MKTELEETEINFSKSQLISIDSVKFEKYPHMQELKAWVKDTTTISNWKIEYLVKTDSTIDKDIYIRISNNDFENLFKGEHLLEYRRYFIPTYLSETKNEIVFEHGCATDCSALTLISKNDSDLIEKYFHVIDFNEERKILLHMSDSSYSHEDQMFQIESVDLKSRKKAHLTLRNICSAVYKPSCIDTIIYHDDRIEVITALRESIEATEYEIKKNYIKN